jgi:uncharacterized protein YuzB (UPF0349 family)
MPSLKSVLPVVFAALVVAAAGSQSAGARIEKASSPPSNLIERLGAAYNSIGVSGARSLGRFAAAPKPTTVRGSTMRSSLRTSSAFTGTSASFGDNPIYWASWADYDNDGRLDVLTLGCADSYCDAAATKLYHNNGDGTFTEDTSAALPDGFWTSIVWGDYDGDGFSDILLNGYTESILSSIAPSSTELLHNNGDGTFTEDASSGLPDSGDAQFVMGDYTGNGRLDIAFNGLVAPDYTDYATQIYRNDGGGKFSEDESAGLLADWAWIASGDYDGNGCLDLLLYETPSANAVLYKNTNTAAASPAPPDGLESFLLKNGVIELSWDESSSKTADNSVTYNLRVGTMPSDSDIVSPEALPGGSRQVVEHGNTEGRKFADLTGLGPGTYYWSVQSVGANYAGGAFASWDWFRVDPYARIVVSKTQIRPCSPRARKVKVSGIVHAGLHSAKVVLQWRFGRHSAWRALAKKDLPSSGDFKFTRRFKKVKRSFWLRARIRSEIKTVVSGSRRVKVKGPFACIKPKK